MSWLVEVYILNPSTSALKAYFSNYGDGGAAIHELEYERGRIGGCKELTLKANRVRAQGHTVAVGDLVEVYTESDDETRARRYRGTIISQDEDYAKGRITIRAWGYWLQFKYAVLTKYLETTDVESVIDDIFDGMKAQTYCETAGNVSLSSSATIGDIEIDMQTAEAVIKKLAELQSSVNYGVDEDGTFYFVDKVTTKRGHFQVGKNISGLKMTERMDKLYNDVLVKTRGVVSSGSLTLNEDDSTSIASYKKRSKVLEAPEFSDTDNAILWAQKMIAENKNPAQVFNGDPMLADKKHFPYTGTVALVDEDGTAIGTVDIEGVKVTYDNKGFHQSLVLGDARAEWDSGDMFAELDREIALLKASNISAAKIEHSGHDEFAQTVMTDAHKTDKYNVLLIDGAGYGGGKVKIVDTYGDSDIMRTIGPLAGSLYGMRGRFRAVPEDAIIQTQEIAVGRALDSVRVYYHIDPWGRYNFADEDALQDWQSVGCGDSGLGGYIIHHESVDDVYTLVGNPALSTGTGTGNRGRLHLQPMNWSNEYIKGSADRAYYQQPDNGYVRFLIEVDGNNGDNVFYCRFNNDITLDNFAQLKISIASGSIDFYLDRYTSGGWVGGDSGSDGDSVGGYIIKLMIDATNNLVKAFIYNAGTSALIDTLLLTMPEQADKVFKIMEMENSDHVSETGDAKLRWFDFPLPVGGTERIELKASRDGGTNWASNTPSHVRGYGYVDLDLSAQGSANKSLILRIESTWPAIIYGLGMAWGG